MSSTTRAQETDRAGASDHVACTHRIRPPATRARKNDYESDREPLAAFHAAARRLLSGLELHQLRPIRRDHRQPRLPESSASRAANGAFSAWTKHALMSPQFRAMGSPQGREDGREQAEAQATDRRQRQPRLVQAAGIDSPRLTASLAIAERVADLWTKRWPERTNATDAR